MKAPTRSRSRRRLLIGITLIGVFCGVAGSVAWYQLFRRVPPAEFASLEDSFKYGSLSTGRGFPLHILRVLPDVFPDKLPGTNGWRAFGMLVEEGRDLPVGWAVRTVGFPGVTFNCALCHSGSFRKNDAALPTIIAGAPAHQLNFGAFLDFLADCADDPRFEPRTLLAGIERTTKLSSIERATYRWVIVPAVQKELRASRQKMAWMRQRPDAGCGRNDAFNVLKINILGLPADATIGTADFPALWNQQARRDSPMHWGGAAKDPHDAFFVSALAACGTASAFDERAFSRATNFIWQLAPPRFPFAINAAQAAHGQTIFAAHCAVCHAGERRGKIIPLSEIRTDANLAAVVSSNLVAKINSMETPPFRFGAWRTTDGYVAAPLDGCWLRAPYLHNGSVPTLWDLLQPAAVRPGKFFRGHDVIDPERVGFINDGAEARRIGSEYDTSLRGNTNAGHDYGTNLSDAEKHALLEHLKTL
jgi:hypothetical protein